MATAEASLLTDATSGRTHFHDATYRGRFNDFVAALLREAAKGSLRVCDSLGCESSLEAIVSDARQMGRLIPGRRFIVEPDWKALKRNRKYKVKPDAFNFAGVDLGPTEVNSTFDDSQLAAVICTTPRWLSEWRGDEFVIVHTPVASVFPQGFVTGGIRGSKLPSSRPFALSTEAVPATESRLATPALDAEAEAEAEPSAVAPKCAFDADAGPLPLTTGDIAFCFDGLRWSEDQWRKPLGDRPKWLQACVAIPGRRGVSATRWNPVSIGAALERDGHASASSVRARFQTRPMLKPWLEAWKTYEADYIDSD